MWSDLRVRIRSLLRRGRAESDLTEELQFHLEEAVRRNLERGMSPAEARREARLEFGGLEQIKEECRDARGTSLVEDLARDLRYAARRLLRDWRFSLGAVAVLTLGIGANTAIFSVVNAAIFREQPFADPDRLVNIYQNVSVREAGTAALPEACSYPVYQDITRYTDLFSGVATTMMPNGVRYQTSEGVRSAVAEFATSNYLEVLGLQPSRGRWFQPRDDEAGADATAVLSHHTWRTRFGSDPEVVGRTLRVNGLPVTIVGVGPVEFNASLPIGIVTDLWLSISSVPAITGRPAALTRRAGIFLPKARLREGVTVAQVRAAMDALGQRLAADYPDDDPGAGITVLEESEVRVHPLLDAALAPAATVLLVSVALVLAIACSNLATLLIVRGASRARELSLRLSLGARRGQVVRHLVAESLLLAVLGGALGCLLAVWLMRLVARIDLPLVLDLSLDLRVLGFAVALTLVIGVVVGLAPALKVTRLDLLPALRDEGDALSLERRWWSLKNVLVAAQVIVSFVLLMGTSFSLRMLVETKAQEVGFATGGVAVLETDARYAGYSESRARTLLEELRQRVAALPGVEAAAATAGTPMAIAGSIVVDEGDDPDSGPPLYWIWAGPGMFETLGLPILHGRAFDDRDRAGTPPVAVVNESMARRYFGTVDAVGQRFRLTSRTGYADAPPESQPSSFEVVGVVPDTLTNDLGDERRPLFFRALAQREVFPTTVVARSSMDAAILLRAMERELRAIDPALPVIRARTMEKQLQDSLAALEVTVAFLATLAGVGLALACIGLYAVVSFAVSQRAREVGIRTALGGRTGRVTWEISRDVAKLLVAAVTLASLVSLVAVRIVGRLDLSRPSAGVHLHMPTIDGGTLPFVALIMLVVGLAAAILPARRAAKADPLEVLRHD